MTIEVYKLIHITGLILLFSGLSALLGVYSSGKAPEKSWRVTLAIVHGLGMALILVSGFGMNTRLGNGGSLPNWVLAKLVLWLALGGSMVLAKRFAHLRLKLILLWTVLGLSAATLGIFKPF